MRKEQDLLRMLNSEGMKPETLMCLLYAIPYCKIWNKKETEFHYILGIES